MRFPFLMVEVQTIIVIWGRSSKGECRVISEERGGGSYEL
jgi:hypothetical protein